MKGTNTTTDVAVNDEKKSIIIGVLSLQGAFEEHQECLKAIGCQSVQVRTPQQLQYLDGIILPGGESTAMGLLGKQNGMWQAIRTIINNHQYPVWGTCAGMILLAERCVGTSAVITDGQALIGGLENVLVCRNYFGSQISSFEMSTTPPPPPTTTTTTSADNGVDDNHERQQQQQRPFPGVFIRAPAILNVDDDDVQVLGKVVATPHRQAAMVLRELERKIQNGENVIQVGVVDSLTREKGGHSGGKIEFTDVIKEENHQSNGTVTEEGEEEEKKDVTPLEHVKETKVNLQLPGAADGTNAREVICAIRKGDILCTAFHPELTSDYRWHSYFVDMVRDFSLRKG